ncbi:MAG: 3-phosphoglycerate dehydrogenase [Alphaproteobacteria bacterium]|nr:MAG: 3-phosphoglycerate dehydrogenase [Alphaproteobacteria bacterium]
MHRVLVAGKLHDSGLAILRAAGDITLDYVEDLGAEAMLARLPQAEAVLLRTQPFDAATVARAPALKIVSRHGVGYDSVDVAALTARGIPLTIVGDVNAQTVAEHAMLLLMAASRRLLAYDRAVRPGGDWNFRNSLAAREICGKTLLIIGLGRIGRQLARMAAGFSIRVLAYDPYLATEPPEGVVMVADLAEGLRAADLVSLHMPRTDSPVLGAAEIAMLRPQAVIVNAARGGAVDEDALASALSAGRLHGAALDVFEREPPQPGAAILARSEAVFTPHSASMTLECAERMAVMAARNIVDFFRGSLDPALVVNAAEIGFAAKQVGGDAA